MAGAQGKYWMFTLFPQTEEEQTCWPVDSDAMPRAVSDWLIRDKQIQYIVCQVECAPGTGRFHVQGYLQRTSNARLSKMKSLSPSAHWELRRGTHQEAKDYCTKKESRVQGPWELGVEAAPEQGKRNDLNELYTAVKAGKPLEEILEDTGGSCSRYEKQLKFMQSCALKTRSNRELTGVRVITLIGETDVGKTYAAIHYIAGGNDYYIADSPSHKDSKMWFDGYQGEKTLILDDFSGTACQFRFLLRLLDKYTLKIEYKGGFTYACWTTVVITTNDDPITWYSGVGLAPLRRRLTTGGSEIRRIEQRGAYRTVDWEGHYLDEDFAPFIEPAENAQHQDEIVDLGTPISVPAHADQDESDGGNA